MTAYPSVEIIIPHVRGRERLERCLASLSPGSYPSLGVCLVDNGTGAGYIDELAAQHGRARVVRLPDNRGYAGGCNAGLESSDAEFVVFFNDDAVAAPGWLEPLVMHAGQDERIVALQPKILSLQSRDRRYPLFDYAGAAGGMLDGLGYPWCRGRTFRGVEEDRSQYDGPARIFWASGVAMFARRQAVLDAGGFDAAYFMHMEEIDLCWRLQLAGLLVESEPASVVWHEGGASLSAGDPLKVELNHRNNLRMIIENMDTGRLLGVVPLRVVLELVAAVSYLVPFSRSSFLRSAGVLKALFSTAAALPSIMRKRRRVQRTRRVSDRDLFSGSPLSVIIDSFRERGDAPT
ncbi:glycosyltransferase family 2 protein [Prosthecochloris sp. N3]|uniref:Glycosyltransferase family 2 protein n=1 Tax=Prosthecochloris ethylica TaxID=2743976 RepID=A0ABR9XTZ6_9CHLB|nr:glycosyltransferase family 2 protein [Prosthecochloris ethylica]MBF0587022.1 glycosyltransferase family 2 protein [Prosthecochloris ethylica]MBF0637382.1 glycosyltransferase family 2 protein [Prosthecochloris ethylica]NUK48138.1 glycosyltransferase family 2 protein [Prosthecochloris ethylica]